MGRRAQPLRFVCLQCGKQCETYSTSKKGLYCSKPCRADFERKGRDAPRSYIQDGYRMLCWTEPGGSRRRPARGFQFEHRRVWEEYHGSIPEGCIIHHVNGDKLDNRIENLRVMRRDEHNRLHAAERKMAE